MTKSMTEDLWWEVGRWLQMMKRVRTLADDAVGDKERRDEAFTRAKSRLASALDAWWEQFKQEYDGQ